MATTRLLPTTTPYKMSLVTYSDSEGSDSESVLNDVPASSRTPAAKSTKTPAFQPLVDRGNNRRKIVVDLKENKTDDNGKHGDDVEDDGPARKRPRIGGDGGMFSGFNAMLPPPKRKTAAPKELEKKTKDSDRPAFSLKTSAAPGFVRGNDEELVQGSFNEYGETVSGAGTPDAASGVSTPEKKDEEVVLKKGNAMMFKPLSVSRNKTKKRTGAMATKLEPKAMNAEALPHAEKAQAAQQNQSSAPPPKPKVSLFGLSSNENTPASSQSQASHYEPLIHTQPVKQTVPGPQPQYESVPDMSVSNHETEQTTSTPNNSQSLTNIANDLNLSKSEMRQLLGRKGQAALDNAGPSNANPKILTFNTDEEYRSNSAYLSSASDAELAAQQHNPIRSIAPGKHSLQQLVNAVSNQREALEESFVAGKRNKKEAGSKYGW